MTNMPGTGKHEASSSKKKRIARDRAASVVAALAATALIVIAAMSWKLSSAEHNARVSTTSTPNAIEIALIDTITRSDLLASMEDEAMNIIQAQEEAAAEAAEEAEKAKKANEPLPLAEITAEDLDAIPSGAQLATFSLFDDAPEISEEDETAIGDAIKAAEAMGNVGIVFLDASTGNGIAYNAGAAVYGASSFKGPYAVYICQELIDTGKISLNSPVSVTSTNAGSIALDPSSKWVSRGTTTFPTDTLITAAVTESDNDAYGMLRNQYDTEGYDEWIARVGVEDAPRDPLTWYPTYCASSSAKLWVNALYYLESDTATAAWLSDLFTQTRTSFIRDGVVGTEGGRTATVRDKAGWIADSSAAYSAVCDAGIIEAGGRTYIMSIMTSQPDCTEARNNVSAIAAALFNAREALE